MPEDNEKDVAPFVPTFMNPTPETDRFIREEATRRFIDMTPAAMRAFTTIERRSA